MIKGRNSFFADGNLKKSIKTFTKENFVLSFIIKVN